MSLLRLNRDIRHRIYRYLNLASWDGLPYRFYLQGAQVDDNHVNYSLFWGRTPNPTLFHGLLLCCRDIYAETTALLYPTNLFVLHYADLDLNPPRRVGAQPPFRALYHLTQSALLSLSHLKIVINESSCHELDVNNSPVCCRQPNKNGYAILHVGNRCGGWHGHNAHQSPFLGWSSTDGYYDGLDAAHAALADWHSAAIHLFSHVHPGRLALSLVCDIDPQHPRALDMTKKVVDPLCRLPQSFLRECNVRLAKTADCRFRQLAEAAVFHTVGVTTPLSNQPPNTVTTLTSLSRELRIRILQYTDLITPSSAAVRSIRSDMGVIFD